MKKTLPNFEKAGSLVYDLTLPNLTSLLESWGEPAYRARQVWQGLYQRFWDDTVQFTDLPATLRTKLAKELTFTALTSISTIQSSDRQTTKTLFKLHDGQAIEAVLMCYGDRRMDRVNLSKGEGYPETFSKNLQPRNTICISTQVGCAMGCVFCATGQMGFKRNLTSGEIVAQVMHYARQLHQRGEKVTNVVVMGMGEPFHNYVNTMDAIDRLNDPEGYTFGARRFAISTVGLVPAIRQFTSERRQYNLAISLHAADDDLRASMLPIARKYPLSELLSACREYIDATGRRLSFEWALIHDINDMPEQANMLASQLRNLLCHVNLIPLNPTEGYIGKPTTLLRANAFMNVLIGHGIPCTIRFRRGVDIKAGCGQLIV